MKNILAILLISVLLISGCAQENNGTGKTDTSNDMASSETLKGVSLSPRSFGDSDFRGFLKKVKQTQDVLLWAGDWNELAQNPVAELAPEYDYIPLIEVGHYIQETGELLRAFNEENKQNYKDSTIEFVKKHKPKYFGIGVEINVFAEKNPEAFEEFVPFYNEVYDAIKDVSPDTKVFTVFQLEKTKGLNGGLFGGINDLEKAQWSLLDKFPTDLTAFTTYPGLIYKDPSEIPFNYYSEISLHTIKPIVFTEIGWHAASSPAGWESSEQEQAEFVETFFNLTKDINMELAVWTFMYDQNTIEPFNSMGLYNSNGTARPAWNLWIGA
jgi:hypothetical protein